MQFLTFHFSGLLVIPKFFVSFKNQLFKKKTISFDQKAPKIFKMHGSSSAVSQADHQSIDDDYLELHREIRRLHRVVHRYYALTLPMFVSVRRIPAACSTLQMENTNNTKLFDASSFGCNSSTEQVYVYRHIPLFVHTKINAVFQDELKYYRFSHHFFFFFDYIDA